MRVNSKLRMFLMLGCLLLVILYLKGGSNPDTTQTTATRTASDKPPIPPPAPSPNPRVAELRAMLEFIPKMAGFSCEELFTGTPADTYNMTPMYHKLKNDYLEKAALKGKFPAEECRALHYAVGQKFVKNVCETGFNAGCSSFYHLTASDRTTVHSFELGGELNREHVVKWLTSVFGDRFSVHLGDSTKTVPEYARLNPDFRCDFMYVDGRHAYRVARAGMINFSNMANLENNFIAYDDYPASGSDFGRQAWEESLADGTVQEVMHCAYMTFKGPRAFVIGVVVKHPNGSDR